MCAALTPDNAGSAAIIQFCLFQMYDENETEQTYTSEHIHFVANR